jgi:hypothetical protein
MQPAEFSAYHEPALEADEVKHGLILNVVARMGTTPAKVAYWTLGNPGECAIKMVPHSIVLGALDKNQCRSLAELAIHIDYPGVVGSDLTAEWFTDRAHKLGIQFLEPYCNRFTRSAACRATPEHLAMRDRSRSTTRPCSPIG